MACPTRQFEPHCCEETSYEPGTDRGPTRAHGFTTIVPRLRMLTSFVHPLKSIAHQMAEMQGSQSASLPLAYLVKAHVTVSAVLGFR